MVHKTSHRGVHSGNTLRAFNSRYSRRYHNQACILSRVHPDLLKKLIGGKATADDKSVEKLNSNVAVDVALSLNKQSRWLLPSALIRQIESDDIAQDELTVSLLERHKLKRPANCVSFHSNKLEGKRHGGRYFGFNYPTADGKSQRALRRERRELLREQAKGRSIGNTVTVYTGNVSRINESEVRYEVFYPSPASSSISHNPKYIKQDVSDAPGHNEDHIQFGKPKKQHRGKQRKRMTLKDIDDCDLPAFQDLEYPHGLVTFTPAGDSTENVLTATDESAAEEHRAVDFLLSSLIEKAERLQNIVNVTAGKSRQRKKSGNSSNKYHHHQDDKSHIVYLTEAPVATEESSSQEVTPFIQPAAPTECTRVLLPTEDVTMATLKECFGQDYFEAACMPRKFVLDVTSNVRELLKKCGVQSRVADTSPEALSFLVFIHDGFYDEEYDVYKILLNTKLHQGLIPVQVTTDKSQQDLNRGTVMNFISDTMDFVKGFITQLQEENHFPCYSNSVSTKAPNRELKLHLGSTEIYAPSVQEVFQRGSTVTDITTASMSELLEEEPVFCDVCYEDISPLTQDSAAATSLLKCRHKVCDNCWAQHIHSRLTQGFVRVTCPGYDCQEEVKVGSLLTLTTLDIVEKVLQRQEEVRVGASATEKWCPNQNCGRVIRLQDNSGAVQEHLQQDVTCACGAHICFQCLSPAHWPATCTQAKDYRANLTTLVKDTQEREELKQQLQEDRENKKLMVVEGKHCPSCKSFVYKFGGCPQMTCRCGQLFCWYCAMPGYSHPSRKCVTQEQEKKVTTTVLVHHLENSSETATDQQQQKSASRRQRVSLLEKAAEHRQHRLSGSQHHSKAVTNLAKAVATAAAKDETLAQHIISICSPYCTPSLPLPSFSSPHSTSTPSRVLDVVTSFLKRSALCKQEVSEVTEYTLVLLKDLPDSLLRKRALRISDDLNAFCIFSQSIFDSNLWGGSAGCSSLQEGVKALTRLVEIQGWIKSAVASHVTTIKKLRSIGVISSDRL